MPLISYAILRNSSVQTYLAKKIAGYFSKELRTEIEIGGVDVTFFMNIVLEKVSIKDLHHQQMIDIEKLKINIRKINFGKKIIFIKKADLIETTVSLKKYKGEKNLNIQFLSDYFSPTDKNQKNKPWKIHCQSFEIKNSEFIYSDENKTISPNNKYFDINNLQVNNLNLSIKNIKTTNDTIHATIQQFSCKEKCNFSINNLQTELSFSNKEINFENLILKTPNSDLAMNMNLKFNNNSNDINDLIKTIKIQTSILPSKISMKDISFFQSDLAGMNENIEISGEIKGSLDNIKIKNIELNYGKYTHLLGDFTINGLPYIDETFIHSKIKNLTFNFKDFQQIKVPVAINETGRLDIPDNLLQLGDVRIKGLFTGFWYDFVSYANFSTALGELSTDISFKRNNKKMLEGTGKLIAQNFDIGKIIQADETIGKSSFHVNLTGSGFLPLKSTTAHIEGTIDSIDVKGYIYKNILMNGELANKKFNGKVQINDKNIDMNFLGIVDYSGKTPIFNFFTELKNVNLYKLNLLKNDSLQEFSTNLNFNFTGQKIDEMVGDISIFDTHILDKQKKYSIKNFNILFSKNDEGIRNISLRSDLADADIKGTFQFSNLKNIFENYFKIFLPSLANKSAKLNLTNNVADLTYSLKLYNPQLICDLFYPNIKIAANSKLEGSFSSSNNKLNLHAESPQINFGNILFKNYSFNTLSKENSLTATSTCDFIQLADSMLLKKFNTVTILKNDSIKTIIDWDNKKIKNRNSGNIQSFIHFDNNNKLELHFQNSNMIFNDSIWTIDNQNLVIMDSNSTNISNLIFKTNYQQILLNGIISDRKEDKFHIAFKQFDLSNFDQLTNNRQIDFDGKINGEIELMDLYHSPGFISNLTIKDFAFNQGYLGDAVLSTSWDQTLKGIAVNMEINYTGNTGINQPLKASGYFYPERITDNFDIDILVDNLKLKSLERYFSSFSSQLTGFANGKLKLSGSTSHPELSGHVKTIAKNFKIDYLNIVYSFTGDVDITKNSFEFNNIILNDEYGNNAKVKGIVTHKNFYKWTIDFTAETKNIYCLNTNLSLNNMFYGKGFASGKTRIYGPANKIFIELNGRTEKGTVIAIPYGTTSDLSENSFITFKTKDTIKSITTTLPKNSYGIEMHCNLEVTPDAEVQIIFDEKIGDVIKGHGTANLEFKLNALNEFNMYGEYDIQKGDYLFTLKNLINKKFEIEQGGTIVWNGDPYDAYVDMKAKYKLRASLYNLISGLIEDSSSIAKYKKRYQVECILGLQNKLFKPDITVEINLPNIDEQTRRYVEKYINVENQEEMNKQLLSLLVLNQFMQPEQMQRDNLSSFGYENAGTTTSSELLFNQLSNWLSKLSGNLDIGVNYRPSTKLTSQEVEIALSKQFYNDRILIDGNIGSPIETNQNKNSSNIVGDVNIEYKITPEGKFRIKAFNKSNHDDLLKEIYSPYTQGLGVFYRKDFDKTKELFEKKKKKEISNENNSSKNN